MCRWLAGMALIVAVALVCVDPGQANSKDGPRRWKRAVKGNSEVVYKIVFKAEPSSPARKFAEFAILGDGSTDVDIFVEDASGKRVTSDEGYTDMGMVRWIPAKTQEYTIRVKNLGNEDNVVQMGHN
jgi:hypothetical protein